MKLTNNRVIAECKREAKKLGYIFSKTDKIQDGEPLFNFSHPSGEIYRVVKIGLAYEIVCSDELKNVARTVGRPTKLLDGKRINVYLDVASLDAAAKIGNGNVSEGIRLALQKACFNYPNPCIRDSIL